jgi:hypothetical protein
LPGGRPAGSATPIGARGISCSAWPARPFPSLLSLLEQEPSHRHDLERDYDTYFGCGKPLRYRHVYATPSRLARDGQAIAGPHQQIVVRDGKASSLTGAGP